MAANILDLSFEFSSKVGTRELPKLSKDYESNIKGLYIVGDLADAPVIKIALNQGYDVAERMIAKDFGGKPPPRQDGVADVAILGAGPSGIGAALACRKHGLSVEVIERERPFNTIQNYPKAKHVFAEPKEFGPSGRFPFMDSVKEDLVELWEKALDEHMIEIHQPEEAVNIEKKGDLFEVSIVAGEGGSLPKGSERKLRARRVILAIGRRGTVNRIGCKGEDLPKVSYGLADPEKHRGEKVLVTGGGDSAVEAALALADAGAEVAISYRGDSFIRVKALNRERIDAAIAAGKVRAYFGSKVKEIGEKTLSLN
jgi:thioredoxin reductase